MSSEKFVGLSGDGISSGFGGLLGWSLGLVIIGGLQLLLFYVQLKLMRKSLKVKTEIASFDQRFDEREQ